MFTRLHPSEINLLRIFITVTECKGVALASQRLGVAPSTISTQLLQLESRLGMKLCNRGRSGFSMTPEGEHVQVEATKIFEQMQRFNQHIGNLSGSLVGELTLGIVDNSITNKHLDVATILRLFQERYPNVKVTVKISSPEDLEQSVLDRRFDIGIGIREQSLSELQYVKLFDEQEVICCSKYHPLFNLDDKQMEYHDLTQSHWVSDYYRLPKNIPQAMHPFTTSYTYNIEASLHLIFAGKHLGTLPKHYIQRWVDEGTLKILREDIFSHYLQFSLITHDKRKNNAIIKSFTSVVKKVQENIKNNTEH
ncbi:LysR family transcriptional regulator [Cocleimonas flava]|uniref:LysR family transcriptional regulator n=1 Tax=Cocleimonas flava TaxID=634765 RepID=A0A4R1EP52_9GAMM|nr:LysR family transcriptional regulator [Cocleimonas flava]TCJ83057.1 LysR family transcriptional regulator [Cocleimonas flava]